MLPKLEYFNIIEELKSSIQAKGPKTARQYVLHFEEVSKCNALFIIRTP